MNQIKPLIIGLAIIIILFASSAYIVDETEQVVITQFGKPIGSAKVEPGIYFKIPFIQHANYFAKNLLAWDSEPGQIPTLDKTFIYVNTFARWKIVDPLKFLQTVNNEMGALTRLGDIIDAAVRNSITSFSLIETVRMTDRTLDTFELREGETRVNLPTVTVGRQQIVNDIYMQAQPKLEEFGIQLMDVKIKRLNYVEEVRRSVYQRMIAERKQIAEKFRSEGHGEARKIEGELDRELKRINSEAYRTAEEIKGKADGEAARIYAQAYNNDPEFYSFLRTLEIYKTSLGKNSSLILSTDSEFLKYLKEY